MVRGNSTLGVTMNILTFGVPTKDFYTTLQAKQVDVDHLYCCESRPYEQDISSWLNEQSGKKITLLTDNMVASLLSEKSIDLFICFGEIGEEECEVMSGTTALLDVCETMGVKCVILKAPLLDNREPGHYFDVDISVPGAGLFESSHEHVSLDCFDEVL